MRLCRPWLATSWYRTMRDVTEGEILTVVDGMSGVAEPDEARSVIRHARRRRRRSSTAHCIFGDSAPRRAVRRLRIAALPTFSFFPSYDQPPSSKVIIPATVLSLSLFLSFFLSLSLSPSSLASPLSLFLSPLFSAFLFFALFRYFPIIRFCLNFVLILIFLFSFSYF